jgi:hypothetical protein
MRQFWMNKGEAIEKEKWRMTKIRISQNYDDLIKLLVSSYFRQRLYTASTKTPTTMETSTPLLNSFTTFMSEMKMFVNCYDAGISDNGIIRSFFLFDNVIKIDAHKAKPQQYSFSSFLKLRKNVCRE